MIVIADSGPIISLALIDKLDLLEELYGAVYIPEAVWQELSVYIEPFHIPKVLTYREKVITLQNPNTFTGIMDPGESEAVSLYQEIQADYLLIDDKTARNIAESLSIKCLGILAVLRKAREVGLISELISLFAALLAHNRFYKKSLLNAILTEHGEAIL
jgi:predicted nucleic acid-binding protein